MKFLRNFFASFLALIVFSVVGLLFFSMIVAALETTAEFTLKSNSVLRINLTQPLADLSYDDPLANYSLSGGSVRKIGVVNLRESLEHAAGDDKIKGIVLYAPSIMGGIALGQEVRQALSEFKKSGKFIFAYSELMTEGGYYMSSVADKIYLSPHGMLEWNGLAVEMNFFKGAFEKLDIKPQIFRVGDYKSAVEPFILDKMSEANRRQVKSELKSIYEELVSDMSKDLDLTDEELIDISNNMKVRSAQDAVDQKLITGLLYRDEFESLVADEVNENDADDINYVSLSQYGSTFSNYVKSKNKIAVIIAEGEIRMGKKQRGVITPDQYITELKRARNDKNVKAIVFRVNSPGGDALASDLIWREVVKTSEVKPVIASMSNYAASGGYYIAMAADTIVAEPTTITGSIGIFGMIFNIGDFMSNKLGITTDRESTGSYSNLYTATRALTDSEKMIIQNSVNRGYETFTSKAAEGRGMSIDDLKSLASGRVWTGSQALDNGLVDLLGGLQTAIDVAAAKANIEGDYKLRYFPVQQSVLEELMEEWSGTTQARLMKSKLGEFYPYVDLLEKIENMKGVQARMPYSLDVE